MRSGWTLSWLPLAGSVLFLLVACAGGTKNPAPVATTPTLPANAPSAVVTAFQQNTPVDPVLVTANNGMGFTLFNQVRNGNTFVSAPSLALALAMTANGAAGQTLAGMTQAMQLGTLATSTMNLDNAALLASLLTADTNVTLQIEQSIWSRNDVLPSFLATNQTYYGAYLGDLSGVPGSVNAWVNQATQGNLSTILDPSFDPTGVDAILANAIYFKGAWTTPFPTAATAPAAFTRLDSTQVQCPMMNLSTQADYAATADASLVRLPYGNGRFAMVFLLPATGTTLDTLAASLTPASWNTRIQHLTPTTLTLSVPKFTAKWTSGLVAPLAQMGMSQAFDPAQADFSALANVHEYLQAVTQATAVEVDETGTTASASTVVIVGPSAVLPQVSFVLNQPFLYAIQDTRTGELLFFGQMLDPTAG